MKLFSILFLSLLANHISFGQCNGRYQNEIFSSVTKTTEEYSSVYNLDLDIYKPTNDTETNRPLVILAHGGAFINGTKEKTVIVELANSLAKRGYVVASISYRLVSLSALSNTNEFIDGVVKGLGDGRAAIRYFYKQAQNGNSHSIDTNKIYFCGNSAGGVIGLHAAFFDDTDSPGAEFSVALNNNGGITGNSGNSGFSNKLAGVISLAGGIADVNFIQQKDTNTVLITAHGNNDNVVPYLCGVPLNNANLPNLCGAGAIKNHNTNIGYTSNYFNKDFIGYQHCPWDTDMVVRDSVFNFIYKNLYKSLPCYLLSNTNEVKNKISVYPNPSNSIININTKEKILNISLYTISGKECSIKYKNNTINLSHLKSGVYYLHIKTENNLAVKKIVRI